MGAVVRPRRTGAGGVVEQRESECPSGGVDRVRPGGRDKNSERYAPATRATACALGGHSDWGFLRMS